jgi:glycosyltransferase involved in cell wall biosynthesis
MSLRVLHLGKFYPPSRGGMETVLRLLCERTSGRIENSVLVANDRCSTRREEIHGVPVVRVAAAAKVGAVAVCPTLPFWLARSPADIVVIHEPNPMALVAYFLVRPAGKLIVWFHSEVIRPQWRYRVFYRPFLRFALTRADRIVVASPTLAAAAEELQDFQRKCVVMPYGVDVCEQDWPAAVVQRAGTLRQRYGPPIVLFVGRMVPYKGLDVLLEALRGLRATAVLVGDGPARPALERRARDIGVAERVVFAKDVDEDELMALYRACDVFVLPSISRQEAFGVVQLEAMACGKPVVSTALPTGVPWVNQDERTGVIVAPGDAPALRAALARLLADPELCAAMGRRGRQRVLAEFTTQRMNDAAVALYGELCGANPHDDMPSPGDSSA